MATQFNLYEWVTQPGGKMISDPPPRPRTKEDVRKELLEARICLGAAEDGYDKEPCRKTRLEYSRAYEYHYELLQEFRRLCAR